MSIITEEYRARERAVLYAIKYTCAAAARKYHTSRQQIWRWKKRYDGSIHSLFPQSRRPHSHPNQPTPDELSLIQSMDKRYGHEGNAEVYHQCCRRGYDRSYSSMCEKIRLYKWNKSTKTTKSYRRSTWRPDKVSKPGEKVQIDIKYVPRTCLNWDTMGKKYYQITAIDEYSRKRYCSIVDEKSVTHTTRFVYELEAHLGFTIQTIQTDNGREFINDQALNEKTSPFIDALNALGIRHKRTRPYSPWQNGKVERSHRIDSERFYVRTFDSIDQLKKAFQRYNNRLNNIHRCSLGFLSPNKMVEAYYQSVNHP